MNGGSDLDINRVRSPSRQLDFRESVKDCDNTWGSEVDARSWRCSVVDGSPMAMLVVAIKRRCRRECRAEVRDVQSEESDKLKL